MDVREITASIDALRAETARNAITPERMGSILQSIVEILGALNNVNVVNNLSSGGEENALSAEMGKVLRNNIKKIYNAVAPYACLDGKPTLDWGSTVIKNRITAHLTNLTANNIFVNGLSAEAIPDEITDGQSLSFKLNVASPLFVLDNDNLSITKDGIDIKRDAYDANTGEINIEAVDGDIVITAAGVTYIQTNLAFQLDCMAGVTKNGNTPTKWKDLIGDIEFDLTDVTIDQDGALEFNGSSSKGESDGILSQLFVSSGNAMGSIEIVVIVNSYTGNSFLDSSGKTARRHPILSNTSGSGKVAAVIGFVTRSNNDTYQYISFATSGTNIAFGFHQGNTPHVVALSATAENLLLNNVVDDNPHLTTTDGNVSGIDVNDYNAGDSNKLHIGYLKNTNYTLQERYFNGKILAIRVYSTPLDVNQMKANYAIDKKRFNL